MFNVIQRSSENLREDLGKAMDQVTIGAEHVGWKAVNSSCEDGAMLTQVRPVGHLVDDAPAGSADQGSG